MRKADTLKLSLFCHGGSAVLLKLIWARRNPRLYWGCRL
ncbi:hypothetical protein WCLP8_3890020 [uncultured Gammaproteobacteria bacterium]